MDRDEKIHHMIDAMLVSFGRHTGDWPTSTLARKVCTDILHAIDPEPTYVDLYTVDEERVN